MQDTILQNLDALSAELASALKDLPTLAALAEIKAQFLGKKGRLTEVLKELGRLDPADRPRIGARANEVKVDLEQQLLQAGEALKNAQILSQIAQDRFDVTLPGRPQPLGHQHPLTQVLHEIQSIFEQLGFCVEMGPEIEQEYYNFEALNIPAHHPARDLQDTFYLKTPGYLLRTHTSTVQVHVMQRQPPPIRMIAPGAVYRCDSDVTHTPMFHQIEGLWIEEGTSFADLKGLLTLFIQRFFGTDVRVRFRASFFPFTEPSAELDISCLFCQAKSTSCAICKGTGWLEVLGCGMVDPEVFRHVGFDAERWTGFAFGMGIERLAMLKFGINDLRLFFENDFRFLRQF